MDFRTAGQKDIFRRASRSACRSRHLKQGRSCCACCLCPGACRDPLQLLGERDRAEFDTPPATDLSQPNFRQVIADNMKTIFPNQQPVGEIRDLRCAFRGTPQRPGLARVPQARRRPRKSSALRHLHPGRQNSGCADRHHHRSVSQGDVFELPDTISGEQAAHAKRAGRRQNRAAAGTTVAFNGRARNQVWNDGSALRHIRARTIRKIHHFHNEAPAGQLARTAYCDQRLGRPRVGSVAGRSAAPRGAMGSAVRLYPCRDGCEKALLFTPQMY